MREQGQLPPFPLCILVWEIDLWLNRWVQQEILSDRLPLLITAGGFVIGRPGPVLSRSA